VPISLETAPGSRTATPTGNRPKGGSVFIAALKQGSVFILGGIHSAFRVKCKRADVFSYYPPQADGVAAQAAGGPARVCQLSRVRPCVRASIRATVKEEGLSAGREADKGEYLKKR